MFIVEEDFSVEIKVKNSLLDKCKAGFSLLFAHRYYLTVPGLELLIVLIVLLIPYALSIVLKLQLKRGKRGYSDEGK